MAITKQPIDYKRIYIKFTKCNKLRRFYIFTSSSAYSDPGSIGETGLEGCTPEGWRDLTFSTLFLTALANRILKGSFRIEAITKGEMKDFLALAFERDEAGEGRIKKEIRRDLREWVVSTEHIEEQRQHRLAFWDFCLELLEKEYGRLSSVEEIDPRFVRGLMVRQ